MRSSMASRDNRHIVIQLGSSTTGEAHLIDGAETRGQQLREIDFRFGRQAERGAEHHLIGRGLHQFRVGVAVNQRSEIVDAIDEDVAVDDLLVRLELA